MRRPRLIAGLAGLGIAAFLPSGARANNDLSTSFRANSISPPAIDGESSSESSALGVNQGRASYRVPVVAPPGVAGLEPGLALGYGGTQSDGEVGAGWSLPVPRLRVRTSGRGGQPDYGVGVAYQGFGGEDLVEVGTLADADGDGSAETAWREERDRLFVRYVALSGGGWRADYPDGRKLTLGTGADNRVVRSGHADQIAEWLPETLEDPRGNQLVYTWDDAAGVSTTAVSPTARYLTEIRYGCQSCASASTYQRVAFSYTARSTPALDFGPGFAIETEALLSTITTASVIGGTASPVRTLTLAYTTTTRPRLTSVSISAADGTSLPITTFTYSDGAAPTPVKRSVTGTPGVNFKSGVQPFDVDLDGRVDVVDLSSLAAAKWYANTGSGSATFSTSSTSIAHPPGKALSASGTASLDDSNRDSALDVFDLGGSKLYAHDGVDGWDGTGVTATLPAIAWSANTLRADVDRDGHVDLVDTSVSPWVIYLDDGAGDFTADTINCTTGTPSTGTALRASSDGVLTGDVNADGLLDIVYIATAKTSASVFYGRGRGCWGWFSEDGHGATAAQTFTITSAVSGPTRAVTSLADINGDGHDDLVMFDATAARLNAWAFTPGSGWSDAGMGGPFVQSISATNGCRLADVDSDGISEAICSNGWKVYDWGNQPRHLITAIDNGSGITSSITYSSSAVIAAQHKAAGHAWSQNVGTALPLVVSTESADGRGNVLVSSYDYRDAAIEVDELEDRAEFAGFAYIAVTAVPLLQYGSGSRAPDPADPGVLTRTWYDLGLSDWHLHGVQTCEEIWAPSSAPSSYDCGGATGALRRTEDTWAVELDGDGIVSVVVDSRDQHQLDGAATGAHLHTDFAYDEYGNPTQEWAYGQWSGAPDATGDDEQGTLISYITDTDSWNLRLTKRVRVGGIDTSGATPDLDRLSTTFLRYDGAIDWSVSTVTEGLRTATDKWTYDPVTGSITTETVEEITHTAAGLDDQITGADGVITDVDYDAAFGLFVVRETRDPGGLGLVSTSTVDPRTGVVTATTGPDGQTTTATYDLLGRLTRIVEPGDTAAAPTLTRSYTTGAPITTITEVRKDGTADGLITTSSLDGHGRLVCQTKEAAALKVDVLVQREHSARGQLIADWRPLRMGGCETIAMSSSGRGITRAHEALTLDALGRPTRRTHQPSGSYLSWSYDGLEISEADENDHTPGSPSYGTSTTRTSDGRGRITAVTEAIDSDGDGTTEDHTTAYAWTPMDQLSTVTDPLGATVFSAIYDSRGRRVSVTDPDRGTVTQAFDAMDRVADTSDARGATISYAYDHAGRVSAVSEATGGVPGTITAYSYDAPALPAAGCKNTAGRLTRVVDGTGATNYCYDERGRANRIERSITALGGSPLRLDRDFDSLGRMRWLMHPDGSKLTWLYGKDSRPSRVTIKGSPSPMAPTYDIVAAATYNGAGDATQLTLGSGTIITNTYDDRMRPARAVVTSGATTLQDLTLALDGTGNVSSITDAAGSHLSASFTYDALDRLTSASGDRYGGHTATYAYDVRGNLTSKASTDTGSALDVGSITYRTDLIHAVATARGETFSYDAGGNLTGDGDYTYSYDSRGMLASVTAAGSSTALVTNGYDHAGHRAVKDSASGTDVYYFPEAGLEIRGGIHTKYVDFGGRTVARMAGTFTTPAGFASTIRYLIADHLGGPGLVLDTTGAVVERWSSHPHGEDNPAPFLASGTSADFKTADDPTTVLARRFQGREINSEDGTYDFGARVYRPDLGRFMSPDSVIPDPGSSQAWNRYAFARNNPMARIDPSGHADLLFADAAAVEDEINKINKQVTLDDTQKGHLRDLFTKAIGDPTVQISRWWASDGKVTVGGSIGAGASQDGVSGSAGANATYTLDQPDELHVVLTRVAVDGDTITTNRTRLDLRWGNTVKSWSVGGSASGEAKGGKAGVSGSGPTQRSGERRKGSPETQDLWRLRSVTTRFDVQREHVRSVYPDGSETWRTEFKMREGSWGYGPMSDEGHTEIGGAWMENPWDLYKADMASDW